MHKGANNKNSLLFTQQEAVKMAHSVSSSDQVHSQTLLRHIRIGSAPNTPTRFNTSATLI